MAMLKLRFKRVAPDPNNLFLPEADVEVGPPYAFESAYDINGKHLLVVKTPASAPVDIVTQHLDNFIASHALQDKALVLVVPDSFSVEDFEIFIEGEPAPQEAEPQDMWELLFGGGKK
jgi:hypothetical protein